MRCVRLSPAQRRCGPCGRIALLLLSSLSLSLVESGAVFAQPATAGQQQISHPFAAYVAEAARRFRIPEHWIVAVMGAESAGATRAVSSAGAMGLMQVMPGTWKDLRARYRLGSDPFDPRDNILAGAAYLREMYDRYGAIPAMLAAYNAGPARYDEYLATGRPLPAETRAYVDLLVPALGAAAPSLNTEKGRSRSRSCQTRSAAIKRIVSCRPLAIRASQRAIPERSVAHRLIVTP